MAWAGGAILLWATLAAAVGDALGGLRGSTVLLWSLLFAAGALVLSDVARGRPLRATLAAPPRLVALGLLGIFGYHALFFAALDLAPKVPVNLLNYLWPLCMVLLARPLAGERLSRATLAGAFVGFAGAVLVVTKGQGLAVERAHLPGYGLAVLAAVAWAAFSVLLRRAGPAGADRMTLFLVASLPPALLFAWLDGGLVVPGGRALAACAWTGVGPMALAFVAWGKALELGSAARLGLLSYVDPLLSTLLLAWHLGERLDGAAWAGMALIIGGAAGPAVWALVRPRGAV